MTAVLLALSGGVPGGAGVLAEATALKDQPWYVQMLLALGIVLVTASMFIGLRNRKKRSSSKITGREQLERARQHTALRSDLGALAVEIEELARRLGAQLDNKAARLEKLLDDADAATARLAQLQESLLSGRTGTPAPPPTEATRNQASGTGSADSFTPAASAAPAPAAPTTPPTAASSAEVPSSPLGEAEEAKTPGGPKDSRASGGGGTDRLAHDVHKLADAGHTPPQIARALDEHVGKIELILALRKSEELE